MIGSKNGGAYKTFDGYIEDVIFFNDVLTQTEVSHLFNTGIKKFGGLSNV